MIKENGMRKEIEKSMSKFVRVFLVIALVLFAASIVVSCTDNPITSNAPMATSSPEKTSEKAFVTSNIALQTTDWIPTPDTDAPVINAYEEAVVIQEEGIRISSNAYIAGSLIAIDSHHPYQYNLPTLIPNANIQSSTSKITAQNLMILYGNKSQDYLLASSKLFLKADAFPYLEKMMSAFASATGKRTVQAVSAYLFSDKNSLSSDFVTGYSIALNVFEDGITYSLSSKSLTAEVNGKTITYFDWFLDNCASFGFVYTGLTGDESRTLATFRFVGIPHALVMARYDIIDLAVYSNLVQMGPVSITDPVLGYEWTIRFYPADFNASETVIPLTPGTIYTISGNNIDGFLVATRLPDPN